MAFDATISPGDPGHIETHEDIATLLIPVDDVAFKVAGVEQGLLSAIPAAGATYSRFLYFATDTDDLYYCDGVVWSNISGIDPTIFDAKGDLVTASAADTPIRLAAGTNGYALVADSTAGAGLAWADVIPGKHAVGVHAGGAQSVADSTNVVILFPTENFDTDALHSTVTNTGRITVPAALAGRWLFTGMLLFGVDADGYRALYLFKNGSILQTLDFRQGGAVGSDASVAGTVVATAAASDYFELVMLQTSGGNLTISATSFFQAVFLGA